MKIALRVCAPPLTPGHLVAFLRDDPRGPYHATGEYSGIVIEAAVEEAQRTPSFTHAVKDAIWPETRKPIARLSTRNQFLALAPVVELGHVATPVDPGQGITLHVTRDEDLPPYESHPLRDLLMRPFVIDLLTADRLRPAISLGTPLLVADCLEGFVEHHLGAAAVLSLQ